MMKKNDEPRYQFEANQEDLTKIIFSAKQKEAEVVRRDYFCCFRLTS